MLQVVQSCIGTKYTSRFGSLMAVSGGRQQQGCVQQCEHWCAGWGSEWRQAGLNGRAGASAARGKAGSRLRSLWCWVKAGSRECSQGQCCSWCCSAARVQLACTRFSGGRGGCSADCVCLQVAQ
jgi:hypothetical protein